ncbi:50S ribosomal protein L24 [Candidatus Wolfebacteria bacterium]|nr:50S ribosomal protein L24 [Candidatus Wolfebacteria bacterium]
MKIKKGDNIKIIKGKDKGKTGKVLKTFVKENKVLVEALNMFKKRVKPKRQGEKGEMISVPRPVQVSNVMLICPGCKNAVRVGYSIEGEIKKRMCKKCKSRID